MNTLITVNDEAQTVSAENFMMLLKLARDFQLGLILILKDLLKEKILPVYLKVRRFKTMVECK